MTIAKVCQFVLQAAAVGSRGETLVLHGGGSIKTADLAQILIGQSGKQMETIYGGMRQNQRLSELLFDVRKYRWLLRSANPFRL